MDDKLMDSEANFDGMFFHIIIKLAGPDCPLEIMELMRDFIKGKPYEAMLIEALRGDHREENEIQDILESLGSSKTKWEQRKRVRDDDSQDEFPEEKRMKKTSENSNTTRDLNRFLTKRLPCIQDITSSVSRIAQASTHQVDSRAILREEEMRNKIRDMRGYNERWVVTNTLKGSGIKKQVNRFLTKCPPCIQDITPSVSPTAQASTELVNFGVVLSAEEMRNKIRDKGGYNERWVVTKTLESSDIRRKLNRFLIPWKKIDLGFFIEGEVEKIDEYKKTKEGKNDMKVLFAEPCNKDGFCELKLRKWNIGSSSNYCLTGSGWTTMAERNGLEAGDAVELWSFRRLEEELCFALVVIAKAKREGKVLMIEGI